MKCAACGKSATRMVKGKEAISFPSNRVIEWIFSCEKHHKEIRKWK